MFLIAVPMAAEAETEPRTEVNTPSRARASRSSTSASAPPSAPGMHGEAGIGSDTGTDTEAATATPLRHHDPLAPLVITAGAPPGDSTATQVDPRAVRASAPAADGADFLRTIPGFSAIGNGGTNGDPVFRGMFGSRLTIVSQGTQLLGACGGRMDPPTAYLAPETFDAVTIIKGPQTVLWGPTGSAGTVLFDRETAPFADPGVRFHGAVLAGTRGRNDQLADLAAGNALVDFRVLAQHAQARDYRDGAGAIVPSRWQKWNLDSSLGWNIGPRTRMELDIGTGDGHARYAGRPMDGIRFKRDSVALGLKQQAINDVVESVTARVYANHASHVMDNFSLRSPPHMHGHPMAHLSNVDSLTMGARAAAEFRLSPTLGVTAGIDAQTQRHRSRMARDRRTAYRDLPWKTTAHLGSEGVFSEWRWDMTPTSRLIAGARVDHAHAELPALPGSSIASPGERTRHAWLKSGFVRAERDIPGANTTVYAGLGHAERFPDYWELFMPGAGPIDGVSAFQSMRPEATTQIDVGARYEQGDTNAWISAYAGQIQDFILFDHGSAAGVNLRHRARQVRASVAGGETGFRVALNPRWQVESAVAYAWGANRTDHRPLPQIPPLDARLSVRYTDGPFSASALWRVVAAQRRIALGQGPIAGQDFRPSAGFGVLSLDARYTFAQGQDLSVGIDNLTNKVYAEHLNRAGSAGFAYPARTPFNQPGRTVWVKLTVDL